MSVKELSFEPGGKEGWEVLERHEIHQTMWRQRRLSFIAAFTVQCSYNRESKD